MDTTSLSFTGAGGGTLGERGYSKDHRPDLMQMIVAVVIDADGRPICSEMWPGNTADVTVLIPVIDRLRSRFGIGRVCVVADRGMISGPTIAALEERGLEYVLGVRERTDTLVRRIVLEDARPFTPLCVRRSGGEETQLFVKEVAAEGRRYIVCRNEAEAAKDAADRRAIIEALDQQLKRGDKALIGNSAYRRYLRVTGRWCMEVEEVGLNWCYGFNHEEAIKCFKRALETDPTCPMVHWGIAYAAGPFYNLTWKEYGPVEMLGATKRCFEHAQIKKTHAGRATEGRNAARPHTLADGHRQPAQRRHRAALRPVVPGRRRTRCLRVQPVAACRRTARRLCRAMGRLAPRQGGRGVSRRRPVGGARKACDARDE